MKYPARCLLILRWVVRYYTLLPIMPNCEVYCSEFSSKHPMTQLILPSRTRTFCGSLGEIHLLLIHFLVAAQRVERWTCDRGFKSYSGQKLRNELGQVVHTYLQQGRRGEIIIIIIIIRFVKRQNVKRLPWR